MPLTVSISDVQRCTRAGVDKFGQRCAFRGKLPAMRGVTLVQDTYYVYAHVDGAKVFYVGMGKNHRAFDFQDPSRGRRWKEYAKAHPGFSVKILRTFDTKEDALAYETKKIKQLNPDGNEKGIIRSPRLHTTKSMMTASQMGKKGIKKVNAQLTPEKRSAAAKKGWKLRKAKLKASETTNGKK